MFNRLKKKIITGRWCIAFRKKGEEEFKVIKNPINCWRADPFVFEYKNGIYIFAEVFNHKRGRACIGYSKMKDGRFSRWQEAIVEDYHLSFPNIKKENENIYIYPESCKDKSLYRYKAISFPDKWEKEQIYLENRVLVDSDFFEYNGTRYLMTYDMGENLKQLLLYKVQNDKVLFDSKKIISSNEANARLGGSIYKKDGEYIRVGQDCVKDYGDALEFYRFKIDDNGQYSEEHINRIEVADLKLNKRKNFKGIHTYNTSENYEVIDLKIKNVIIYPLLVRLIKKAKKIISGKDKEHEFKE